jgi:hypothetical protein
MKHGKNKGKREHENTKFERSKKEIQIVYFEFSSFVFSCSSFFSFLSVFNPCSSVAAFLTLHQGRAECVGFCWLS